MYCPSIMGVENVLLYELEVSDVLEVLFVLVVLVVLVVCEVLV